jgi:hypothetical protein
MPGLSALEYLRLESGDVTQFVNNGPAHAPGFGASASPMAQPPAGAGRWGKLRCRPFA